MRLRTIGLVVTLSLGLLAAPLPTEAQQAEEVFRADVEVAARANSSSGGSGKAIGFKLVAGDLLSVGVDAGDMWSAGGDQPCSRRSNADGLQKCYGPYSSANLTAAYGSLVGRIGNGPFFLIGTSFKAEVEESGPLLLYYWDSNAGDNTGSVTAALSIRRTGEEAVLTALRFLKRGADGWEPAGKQGVRVGEVFMLEAEFDKAPGDVPVIDLDWEGIEARRSVTLIPLPGSARLFRSHRLVMTEAGQVVAYIEE